MPSSLDVLIACLPVSPGPIQFPLLPHQRNTGKEDPREQQSLSFLLVVVIHWGWRNVHLIRPKCESLSPPLSLFQYLDIIIVFPV